MATVDPVASSATLVPPTPAPPAAHSGFSFHDILNIVNPLQHIPVVSTIYRAITGDQINPFEKVAGDTLYGGVIGFVSSMADTIFQAITGKDFGDTVLSFLTGSDHATAVASNSGSTSSAMTVSAENNIAPPDLGALNTSLSRNGIDPTLARRAAAAYRHAVDLTTQPLTSSALAQPSS